MAVPLTEVFFSELVGTALLTLLGCGVVANVALSRTLGHNGGWLLVTIGWGFAVLAGAYAAYRSGAHINPAVTVGILTSGASAYAPGIAVTAASTVTYLGGQLVGAFLGATACYLAYKRHFDEHTGADDQGPEQEAPAWRESSELDRRTSTSEHDRRTHSSELDGGTSSNELDRGTDASEQGRRSVGVAVRERSRIEARSTTASRRPDPAGAADKLGVFATGPAIASPVWNLVTEVIGTFVLVLVVLLFGKTPSGLGPAAVALLVVGIGASLGGPTGYAINPARDLGPRIAHAVLPIRGKGSSNWAYAWVPVVGPLVGGILAGLAANALS